MALIPPHFVDSVVAIANEDNLRKHGNFFYWEYNFEIDYPGIYSIPWFSAMAQGEGASVLLRAYHETKNKEYLYAATKAIEPILYDISQGGISVIREESYIFPQEISTNPPSDILNGAITAYIGLYEYYRVTDDRNVKKFCEIVVKTFSDVLEQFDTGYWSLYSRWPKYLADPHYNAVHVLQLKFLYLMTGNKKFLVYSRRFQDYQNNWINRVKYVFSNHMIQAQELSFKDINKIPSFLKQYL